MVFGGKWHVYICIKFKSFHFSPSCFCDFQYEFDAFGRHFHLLLKHDPAASSATRTLRAHHVFSNHSHVQPVHQDASRCFYSGTVRGDDKSKVNLNLCHGMVSTKKPSAYFEFRKVFTLLNASSPFLFRQLCSRIYFRGPNALWFIPFTHQFTKANFNSHACAESLKSVRLRAVKAEN